MEPNLQKSDDDACGNRSHPPPLRDSGYDGGRELSGEGGEPSPPPRGGGASDGFTDLFYGRGIGNTNPQHRQKLLTFNMMASCKLLVGLRTLPTASNMAVGLRRILPKLTKRLVSSWQ